MYAVAFSISPYIIIPFTHLQTPQLPKHKETGGIYKYNMYRTACYYPILILLVRSSCIGNVSFVGVGLDVWKVWRQISKARGHYLTAFLASFLPPSLFAMAKIRRIGHDHQAPF